MVKCKIFIDNVLPVRTVEESHYSFLLIPCPFEMGYLLSTSAHVKVPLEKKGERDPAGVFDY